MKRKNKFSDWREDLIEVNGIPEKESKTDTDSEKEITEKKIKNKIIINPSMKEAFEEIGGTLLEVTELDEKLDMKKADMGDVIDDFYKSDAPQFKGKSKKKRREMAIAAKLEDEDNNDGGGESMGEGMECAHNMKGKDCPVHGKKDCSSMKEATEDSLKDRRMERGGVDGNNRYKKPISNTPNLFGKKKPVVGGPSAIDVVKAQVRSKYGKGAIKDTKKK